MADPQHARGLEPPTRCTALTVRGERCRCWALRAPEGEREGPPLCSMHVKREGTEADFPGRCTARGKDGKPCNCWAVRGSDPPRCHIHSSGTLPEKGDEGRCRAMTRQNTRCRSWATIPSRQQGKPRCRLHGGEVPSPRPASGRRCSATTRKGKRCRSWALPDSDPPLCVFHSGRCRRRRLPEEADYEAGRACSATTLKGRRCRKWAIAHTDPPRCYLHAYPNHHPTIRHGFYRQTAQFSKEWYAYIAGLSEQGDPLGAELMLLRLKLREVLTYLDGSKLSPSAFLAAAALLDRGLRSIARLVEAREKLRAVG